MISGEYNHDNQFPKCQVITCGSPRLPKGAVRWLGNKDYSYGKKVTFECGSAYYHQGDPHRECDEFGDWIGEGACILKKCTLPDDLKNTVKSINRTEFTPNETVEFSCKPGSYLQSRHNTVSCTMGGLWDKSIPSCDLIKCTNPPGIVNGTLADKNTEYNIGDVARYQCNTGHEFSPVDGSVIDAVPCLATGKFDTTLPRCVPITCSDPPRQRFAVAVGEGRAYLSSVRYECLPGFTSSDKNVIECEADKEWSPLRLNCSKISCGAPPAFGNGSLLATDYKFESTITYQCDQGYILRGASIRKCLENKTWSDTAPICDPVSCGDLPPVANGNVTYADVTFLNTATFTCNPGYQIIGPEESTCEASGNWLPDPPTCEPRPCPLPQDIEFGSYSVSGPLVFRATVAYTCGSGYRLTGTSVLSCLEDGNWSALPPNCVFIQCPDVGNLTNGFVSVQGRTLSSTVTYTCQSGYKLSGPSTRTCQSNSTWSHQAPTCLPTYCSSPENIVNGRRDYKDLSVGSIVSYSCDKGYKLEGKVYRRCLDNLTFSDPAPVCKPVKCNPLGSVINGVVSLSDEERTFTSTATVVCDEGYNVKGKNVLKCESTGQWSSTLPTCVPVACNVGPIQNGRTNSTTALYQSVISYECNSGFKIAGSSLRKCLANGSWDSAEPTCEMIRCPQMQLSNGVVLSTQRTVGAVVNLECKVNYRLTGPSSRTCQTSGQWSGDEPSCSLVIACPQPDPVLHGELRTINESTVQYGCDNGYSLLGASVSKCGPDGVWRPPAPACKIKTCDDLSQVTVPNGKIVYTSNEYKAVVSYVCNTGYILQGNDQRKCKDNGQWDGSQPDCELVDCGIPKYLNNGKYLGTNFAYGSGVKLECDKDFKLKGPEYITCLSNGLWDSYNSTCEPIECPPLTPDIPNGKVIVNTNVINGVAKYECSEGYRVQGSSERVCLESGQWSGLAIDCERVICPEPDPVKNGVFEGDKREYGAVVTYQCNYGYNLYGGISRVCQQDGKWSSIAPDCDPIFCQESGVYVPHLNSVANDSTVGSIIKYDCDEGFELVGPAERVCQLNATFSGAEPWCTKVSCGEPPAIPHAEIIQPGDNLYQSSVQYFCLEGYTASGLDMTSCLSNKSWSYTDFACTIISCPDILPSAVPNSILQAFNLTYGSVISFSCIQGYNLSGSSNLTCTAQGNWNSPLPSCLIIQCPVLGQLQFGSVTSSSNDYNSKATFSCRKGYTLVGDSETQCLASGTWSLPKPICRIVSCGALPLRIPNGILLSPQSEYVFEQSGSYSCEFGYNLTGSPTLSCAETGQFDFTLPACLRTPCPSPTAIDYGAFREDNYTVFYECFSGYELVGTSELDCLLGGVWSGQAPSCQPAPCPSLLSPDNGAIEGTDFYFEKLVRFSCKEGYKLIGSSELECLANQSWSDIQPYCTPVDCGAPKEHFGDGFFNGTFIYGGGVEYHCHPGFQLLGDKLRLCQANGLWETFVQNCSRLNCQAPESLTNGYITGSSYLFESNITYTCNEGYQLVGDSLSTCLSNLSWSGQTPACEKISCGLPPILTNGKTVGNSYLFQDKVILTCDFGYRLDGVASRTCESSGQWSGLAQCDQIVCKDAPNLVNGRYRVVSNHTVYSVLSVIQYECDRGFILNGTHERTCQETGLWSDDPVNCHPISCSSIPSLEYGAVIGSSFTFLSVVNFTCQAGFDLIGQKSIECNSTGHWSAQVPYCKVISCPDVAIQHGSASLKDASQVTWNRNGSTYIYGDRITFECDEGHESEENWTSSECRVDGSWSNPSITCTPVECLLPTGIAQSNISWSSLTYQSIITVSCVAGYDLIGEDELTCGADRNWVEPLPKCVLLACGSPPSVANAIIEGDSFKLGDFISYKCKSGYDLVGNTKIQCGNGNIWVGILPECVEVDCGPPPVLQAATVTTVSTTYKSQANLACNVGYVQRGDAEIICSADRTWKYDPNLYCAAIDCGNPPLIEHGAFSVSNTTLGNLASYSCDSGYFLKDVSSVVCSDDGTWDYDIPECIPVDCLQPSVALRASFAFNGTYYLQKVKYTCDIGYQLIGGNKELELICGETGTWQGDVPECEAVDCGWPPSAVNAYFHLDNNRTDYTSLAVYHCLSGHSSPKVDNIMSCNAAGVWEGELISCSPLNCTDLPTIDHGLYDFTNGTLFQSVISYNCSTGFTQTGSTFITCTKEGKWSHDYHACLPVNCQTPPAIDNGDIDFDQTIFGSLAVYSCLPGYTMIGNETLECTDTGHWSFVSPRCQPVDCKAPPSISYGHVAYHSSQFQGVATYSCDSGYRIGQATILTCSELASWEGQLPTCSIVNCSRPITKPFTITPTFNVTYLSTISYTCEPGYKVNGNNTITCLESGQWSADPPDCTPLNCSSPVHILHGNLVASGTTFGSSVAYTCHQGYHLKGNAVVYCDEHGAWGGVIPSCEILDCKQPAGVANGQVTFITTTFASLATYQCDKGFLLKGDHTLRCDESGRWTSSGAAPVCEVAQCPEPSAVPNGRAQYIDLTHGSVATYSCDAGYGLKESRSIVCDEDGIWQGEMPVCEQIVCPEPPQIQNGQPLNRNTSVGVRVEYKCAAGYTHIGISFIECQFDGLWSDPLPVCIPVKCPNPPVVQNTRMTAKAGNFVGSTVTYTCLTGFEMTIGSDDEVTIVCLETGQWSVGIPACTLVTCKDSPPVIPFSNLITNGNTYASEAQYTCQVGYRLRGSGRITCDHLGQWTVAEPIVCDLVSCGPPPVRQLSSYDGSSFTFNQSVTYKCNPGHDLIGSATSYCIADGTWTPVAFQCRIRQCTEIFAIPENGDIIANFSRGPFIVGAVIGFKCSAGYTLIGQPTMTCTDSGDWSSEPPLCENIIGFCKETLQMDHITPPPPGQLIGSQIIINCLSGYVAQGNMTAVCQSDGSWTLPTGSCDRVFCGKPVVDRPLNVKLIGQNYFYGDQVAFICQLGFVPQSDNSVLTCQENGQWDSEARCIAFCKQDCLNGGTCIGSNRCKCLPGWGGFRCEKAVCIFHCLHGGQCIAPYKCQCRPGYDGSRCEKILCTKPCQNGGRCIAPNKCQCPHGYSGAFCETLVI